MAKSHLVSQPIFAAHMRHRLAQSRISAPTILAGRFLIPFYLRFLLGFKGIEILKSDQIISELCHFQEKRTRLIVAFRHPYGDEPQLVFHVFNNLLHRRAKKSHQPLACRPHVRMVHDYAVPLWGDALIRFVLPRAGAVPVYHIRFDPESLRQIRRILTDDLYPLGIAPEGQVSYHSETLPRIEQGTIRMGFWCARDLEKNGRPEHVHVLPISIHYQYDRRDIGKVYRAIRQLEQICGLETNAASRISGSLLLDDLQARIIPVEIRILELAESFYAGYGRIQPQQQTACDSFARQRRWSAVLAAALETAEQQLGLMPVSKDIFQRIYRIRQACWDRIYPETAPDNRSPLEAAMTDRLAGEAWYAMRHMEFVDLMSYHDVRYLEGEAGSVSSFDRIVETLINLQDLAARLMGGNITTRPNVIRKKAILIPAPVLDLTARLPEYHKNARQASHNATEELSRQFEACIKEYQYGTKA